MTSTRRESYEPPPGYVTEVQSGWPSVLSSPDHLGKSGVLDSDYAGGRIPGAFEVAVISGAGDDPDRWMVIMMFTVLHGEIRLVSVYAVDIEADAGMKAVTQIRPLGWWKKFAVSEIARQRLGLLNGEEGGSEAQSRIESMRSELESMLDRPVTRDSHRLTDEKLREVAGVYRQAMEAGLPPTRAVQDHFTKKDSKKYGYSTVARWVGLARKVPGGLGPAVGKLKAGERTDDEA